MLRDLGQVDDGRKEVTDGVTLLQDSGEETACFDGHVLEAGSSTETPLFASRRGENRFVSVRPCGTDCRDGRRLGLTMPPIAVIKNAPSQLFQTRTQDVEKGKANAPIPNRARTARNSLKCRVYAVASDRAPQMMRSATSGHLRPYRSPSRPKMTAGCVRLVSARSGQTLEQCKLTSEGSEQEREGETGRNGTERLVEVGRQAGVRQRDGEEVYRPIGFSSSTRSLLPVSKDPPMASTVQASQPEKKSAYCIGVKDETTFQMLVEASRCPNRKELDQPPSFRRHRTSAQILLTLDLGGGRGKLATTETRARVMF